MLVVATGWAATPESAEAQARFGTSRTQRNNATVPADSARTDTDRETVASFVAGQAPAGEPSPFSATGGTANRQIRRYRGDNNEFNFEVGLSGRNIGFSADEVAAPSSNGKLTQGMGFTIDKVTEGYYMPGFGVNNGFAAPGRVNGGFHMAGWGVMGGLGDFNGRAATQQVQGGTYIPGFGVGAGPAVMGGGAGMVGNQGGPAVIGNFGNPAVGGFAAPAVGSTVSGGSYVPGFGVTGSR